MSAVEGLSELDLNGKVEFRKSTTGRPENHGIFYNSILLNKKQWMGTNMYII